MVLAHKIRLKRKEKGYSQDYMADQLGITSSTYSKIERGETRLDVDRLKQITEVLEVDILDLLSEDSIIVAYNGDCSVNDTTLLSHIGTTINNQQKSGSVW